MDIRTSKKDERIEINLGGVIISLDFESVYDLFDKLDEELFATTKTNLDERIVELEVALEDTKEELEQLKSDIEDHMRNCRQY